MSIDKVMLSSLILAGLIIFHLFQINLNALSQSSAGSILASSYRYSQEGISGLGTFELALPLPPVFTRAAFMKSSASLPSMLPAICFDRTWAIRTSNVFVDPLPLTSPIVPISCCASPNALAYLKVLPVLCAVLDNAAVHDSKKSRESTVLLL